MRCCGGRPNKREYSYNSRTSYQVSGIPQETAWEIFKIRAEEGLIVKVICFCIYVWRFIFFPFAVVLRAFISSAVWSVGTAFPMEVWWRHDMDYYFIFLYTQPALLLCTWYLVAGVCLSYPAEFVFALSDGISVAEWQKHRHPFTGCKHTRRTLSWSTRSSKKAGFNVAFLPR